MITDNIMVASEIHHFLKRKRQGKEGYMAPKIDMSKEYDRGEWNLLEAIMEKMGFGKKWIKLMMECITTVEYFFLDEGDEIGPIKPQWGLRQGDPLSPYLFILILEGLNAMISTHVYRGFIHGINISRGGPKVSHILFADDCFFFVKANPMESYVFRDILIDFANASGQEINFEKSSVSFSGNVKEDMKVIIEGILGINREGYIGKYLGLPSLVGRNKREILGFIKGKIISHVQGWNNRWLSRAGREVLLKNVV